MADIYRVKPTLSIDDLVASFLTNSAVQFEFDDDDVPGIIGRVIILTTNEHAGRFFLTPEDELQDLDQVEGKQRISCGIVISSESSPRRWLEGIYRTDGNGLLRPVPIDSPLRRLSDRK